MVLEFCWNRVVVNEVARVYLWWPYRARLLWIMGIKTVTANSGPELTPIKMRDSYWTPYEIKRLLVRLS